MAYHRKPIKTRPIVPQAKRRFRRGNLIIEAVVAMALFSTAVVALGRLSRSTASLSVQADQRLSAQLTGENALARLQATPLETIESVINDIQTATETPTSLVVKIDTEDFDAGDQAGVHFEIRVSPAQLHTTLRTEDESAIEVPNHVTPPLVTLHDWRLVKSGEKPESDNENSEANDEDE